ncbi:MAG: carboxypeptidase-like regulatory domain-containing protein [Myxococcota bacterium]|nr:carboxypeptidase-like regulatory domain-containing protein [Myxococcota bacterium]
MYNRWSVILVMLGFLFVGCSSDPANEGCDPAVQDCSGLDSDGDGVVDGEDDFPQDEACFEVSDENCFGCGQGCSGNGTCLGLGFCVCAEGWSGNFCDVSTDEPPSEDVTVEEPDIQQPEEDAAEVTVDVQEDTGPSCLPNCEGKVCGDDGCGDICGTCPDVAPLCDAGLCFAVCEPDCEGKVCGSDGCGGSCGNCLPPLPYCTTAGQCIPDPTCEPGNCTVEGTVLAPEGSIPIAGALVLLTHDIPEPKNQGVYCDACVIPPFYVPHAFSSYDGTFSFEVPETGEWFLVVEKGGFRRVRTVTISEGNMVFEPELTTLPADQDPDNGDDIPKMAVVGDAYDNIENTLAKLGLGAVDGSGDLVGGTEAFDLYDTWSDEQVELLLDWDVLSQYHVVFFPCDSSWPDDLLLNPVVLDNLRTYVQSGGRLYVTDWSYDILNEAFPGPILWVEQTAEMGSAELGIYDAPAIVNDAGLQTWLQVQDIEDFDLEDNWTGIDSVQTYLAENEYGNELMMEPTVWVSSDVPSGVSSGFTGEHPATVSFQNGCGRAMFSTYHTEGFAGTGLMAQERALLYIILEVAACIGHVPMN